MSQVKLHPVCEVFPPISDIQFEQLKADIKENGQRESITYWNGFLVDGRHRLMACQELGIEPKEGELDSDCDPVAWAISQNLHRRHLVQSQRALVAAKMATLKRGDVGNGRKVDPQNCGSTTDDAAELLSVSPRSVESAKHVLENGSKQLIEAVEKNEITVSLAQKLCKAEPDKREQSRLVKEGKKAIREFLNPPDDQKHVDSSDEVGDQYEYQIVNLFEHADYRLNTLKKLVANLTETERAIAREWFAVQ